MQALLNKEYLKVLSTIYYFVKKKTMLLQSKKINNIEINKNVLLRDIKCLISGV